MNKKLFTLILICCLTLLMPLSAYAINSDIDQQKAGQLMTRYMEALASGEKDLPSIELIEESQKLYQKAIDDGQYGEPTKKWLELTEAQYEADMQKIRKEIDEAGIETDGSKAIANVYPGYDYTCYGADCGNQGKSEYCDDYEDGGNFRCGWGTTSGGYADALSENCSTINIHSATTWAWMGKQIKVNGTGDARIYFDGNYAYYTLGGCTYPTWCSVKVKAIVYNVTDSQEVASKTIAYHSNFAPIPGMGDNDFNEAIDCTLLNGKTYVLKMEVTAYISAGSETSADMCSGLSPAAGGDGVNYGYMKVTWR
ncbi:MAG: hypothetical protein GX133_04830 [Syntrophomonadaceae bacterium]|nr:hypothetical protein [Syntrophomonadaceae bacterium]